MGVAGAEEDVESDEGEDMAAVFEGFGLDVGVKYGRAGVLVEAEIVVSLLLIVPSGLGKPKDVMRDKVSIVTE